MSSSGDESGFAPLELDLWLFEEPGSGPEGDRAHRLKRLQLTVAELEQNAATAEAAGDHQRAADLRKLANELRAKHAKWDRRAARPPKWRYVLRRYLFNRRRSPR